MALIIHYSTPNEIQSGVIRVPINFTDDNTNNPLYIRSNEFRGTQQTNPSFKLIDSKGNDLPSGSYSIDVQGLISLDYRDLVITISEGSGSFSITTEDNFHVTGYEIEHPTNTTSGGVSLENPQTSNPINYDATQPKTTDTPSDTPTPVQSQPEDDLEDDPEDNLGPDQTQLISVSYVGKDQDSEPIQDGDESEDEKELPQLNVAITHIFSDPVDSLALGPGQSRPEGSIFLRESATKYKIIIWYVWYFESLLVPVLWGGPFITVDPDNGAIPEFSPKTPEFQRSSIFTQVVQIPINSKGTIGIIISPDSASWISFDNLGNEIDIFGPPANVTYYIDYNTLIEDVIPPTLHIVQPSQQIVSTVSIDIEFHWSEPINRFNEHEIKVSAENFSGTEIYLTKGPLETIASDKHSIKISFSRNPTDSIDIFESKETGMATIRVEAYAATDLQRIKGPVEPVEMNFNYDLSFVPPDAKVTGRNGNPLDPVCNKSFSFDDNPFLDKTFDGLREGYHLGGGVVGVSDFTLINQDGKDYLYGVMQIARKHVSGTGKRTLDGPSGGALFQLDLSQDCKLNIIKAYPYYEESARSLVEYDHHLYFYEGSHYAYNFLQDVESPDRDIDWRNRVGRLRSFKPGDPNINDQDPTTDHGIVWKLAGKGEFLGDTAPKNFYEEEVSSIHKATSAPMRVIGKKGTDPGDLYLYSGFGNLSEVSDTKYHDSQSKQWGYASSTVLDNWILLKYGKRLEYRIPTLNTNQKKGYEILNEFAKITGSYVGFAGSTIFYIPKFPRKAKLSRSLDESSTIIEYTKNSREFPDSGLLLIETIKDEELIQEIIKYDGHIKDNRTFESLERKQYETNEEKEIFCPTTTEIYYVDYVFDMDANHFVRPLNELNYRTDFNQLYNQFTLRHSSQNPPINEEAVEHYIENKESVNLNGGKELEIEVPSLDERYMPWIEWLGDFYVDFYSDLHYLTNLTVVSSFHFKLGDLVLLRESKLSKIEKYRKLQVLNISQNKQDNTTRLQLRTI